MPAELLAATESHNTCGGFSCLMLEAVQAEPQSNASQPSATLLKLFAPCEDSSIVEAVFMLPQHSNVDKPVYHPQSVLSVPPKVPARDLSAKFVEDEDDGFVVPDDVVDGAEEDTDPEFASVPGNPPLTLPGSKRSDMDLSDIYDLVARPKDDKRVSVQGQIVQLRNVIEHSLQSSAPARLLFDMVDETPYIADVDEDFARLEQSILELNLTRIAHSESMMQTSIARVDGDGAGLESGVEIYNSLLRDYVHTLSSEMPARIRVNRERLARQVATELYLSNYLIRQTRPPESSSIASQQETDASAPQPEPLPVSSVHAHSDSIRLPPPTEAAGTQSSFSQGSTAPTPSSRTSTDPLSILRQYTTVSAHPTPSTISPSVTNTLAHLPSTDKLTDPQTYSYKETLLSLSLSASVLQSRNLDAKTRRRMERLADAKRRKLDTVKRSQETARTLEVAPTVLSSQIPVRQVMSSQGGRESPDVPAMGEVTGVSMTQPVPGTFGTREARTRKKKKTKGVRRAGF